MKVKYLAILPVAVAGILIGNSMVGVSQAQAVDTGNWPPLVQRLAERFGLDTGQVNQEFENFRGERQAQREAEVNTRLQTAVDEGHLTAEQMVQIQAKHDEWRGNKPDMSGLSWEERGEAREVHHEEMEAWEEEMGIDMHEIMGDMQGHGGGRFDGRGMMHQ